MSRSPKQIDRQYTRRDTKPIPFRRRTASGGVFDITGYSYVFHVDTRQNPSDASTIVFSVIGTLDDPANGLFSFPMTTTESDQTPGVFYYRVVETDPTAAEETIAAGEWKLLEDIRP